MSRHMSVKTYPTKTPDLVGTLPDRHGPSMGWQPPLDPATVLPMAEDDLEVGKRVEALRTQRGGAVRRSPSAPRCPTRPSNGSRRARSKAGAARIRAIADALEVDEYAILGEPVTQAGVPLSSQLEQVVTHFSGQVNAIEERQKHIVEALDARVEHDKRRQRTPRQAERPPTPAVRSSSRTSASSSSSPRELRFRTI